VSNADKANSILLYSSRRQFWEEPRNWNAQGPTLRNLLLFLEPVEREYGEYHDIALVIYDELLAIYSQFRHAELERTALEMLRRTKRRLQGGTRSGEVESWHRNANYQLAWFYHHSGDAQRAIKHLEQVMAEGPWNEWELEQFELLHRWKADIECDLAGPGVGAA
jgi:hypothetical protein